MRLRSPLSPRARNTSATFAWDLIPAISSFPLRRSDRWGPWLPALVIGFRHLYVFTGVDVNKAAFNAFEYLVHIHTGLVQTSGLQDVHAFVQQLVLALYRSQAYRSGGNNHTANHTDQKGNQQRFADTFFIC